MEQVEAGRQSVGLPSIHYVDSDKMKREEAEYQRKHSASAMVSPSYPYSCPPPPYSHPPTTSSVPNGLSGLISPPESRRTSGEEKDQIQRPPARQSLPSIHEALGGSSDQRAPLSFSQNPPPPPPPAAPPGPPGPAPHIQRQDSVTSPSDFVTRSYTADPHPHPDPYSTPRSPHMGYHSQLQSAAPQSVPPQPDAYPRPSFPSPHQPKLPTLHPLRTAQSPTPGPRSSFPYGYQQQQQPAAYEQSPHPAHGPPSTPSSSFGYNQNQAPPVPPQYPYSGPPPASASGSAYPSSSYSATPRYPPPTWRSDGTEIRRAEESKQSGRITGPAYGEAVKRHLDTFDLEASLNEIAEGSGQLLEFSRHYGQRAHQTQRSGPIPGSLPNLADVDNLLKKNFIIAESLQRIRDVVCTQQAALAEQAQDQRFKGSNGYDPENISAYADDNKNGGFAGSDPKKRRGRAAPPGRCHSCNRAETPEWRRGPDGARTLCNACGLHYAKLTRKMGTNKAAVGSSNLRPKSLGPNSPGA